MKQFTVTLAKEVFKIAMSEQAKGMHKAYKREWAKKIGVKSGRHRSVIGITWR